MKFSWEILNFLFILIVKIKKLLIKIFGKLNSRIQVSSYNKIKLKVLLDLLLLS